MSEHREKIAKYAKQYRAKNRKRLAEYMRQFQAKNKKHLVEYDRERKRNLKMEIVRQYGGECVCCGEKTIEFLTIDHIDGNGAKHRRELYRNRAAGGTTFYYWLRDQGYPKDNYQLLCMNCNFAKSHYGGCPHQRQNIA